MKYEQLRGQLVFVRPLMKLGVIQGPGDMVLIGTSEISIAEED